MPRKHKRQQFPSVDSSCGAPFGRAASCPGVAPEGKVRLFRVNLDSGGYDDGGAYWGIGTPLYCAWGTAKDGAFYRRFTRALTRYGAAQLLGLRSSHLIKPVV